MRVAFEAKVDRSEEITPCHEWLGAINTDGRGFFQGHMAHRLAYAWHAGKPAPTHVRQTCGNKVCVRPDHLEGSDDRWVSRKPALSAEQAAEARELYAAGTSVRTLSKRYGVAWNSVRKYLRQSPANDNDTDKLHDASIM